MWTMSHTRCRFLEYKIMDILNIAIKILLIPILIYVLTISKQIYVLLNFKIKEKKQYDNKTNISKGN